MRNYRQFHRHTIVINMKTRTIILHKDEILYDIEGLAYKFAESTALEGKAKNILAADHEETLDGRLLSRMINARFVQLKNCVTFALAPVTQETSCNIPNNDTDYILTLSLNDKFNDNMLDVVQTKMHEYIVTGVLLDWYKRLGLQTAAVDSGEILELEESIVSVLRTPSYTKKPLQPFGPSK